MDAIQTALHQTLARRTFLKRSTTGLGALALTSLFNPNLFGMEAGDGPAVFVILLLGALVVPMALFAETRLEPPMWTNGSKASAKASRIWVTSCKAYQEVEN